MTGVTSGEPGYRAPNHRTRSDGHLPADPGEADDPFASRRETDMDAHFESEVVLLAGEELDAVAGGKPSQAHPVHADL